ncbi:hypothetical protein PJ311_15370 [Bacillus sp. CLL-7-23]|uniref:Uncharacterized protein n=1 Tax=Bacillus changyiensis TaxID=3004103 RepID=A0ABT4X6Q8_9BACI|nr:hypothetical protein [Bacillus changyiensis]MDA7027954.1 hypothetical protein [Bacillus changyiensis]
MFNSIIGIFFGVTLFFSSFYLVNYIGQKLIALKTSVNHKMIVSISLVEAFVALGFTYYGPLFLT